MTKTLFTIGYSGLSIDDLISLLRERKISALCDVRSMPYSTHNPQFNRELLKASLNSHNIQYVFLGEELGARPKDPSCYIGRKDNYHKITSSALFKNGLERIMKGVQTDYVLALMCAEKDPMSCHRSILICRNLRDRQISIQHIIDREITETQYDLEKRLIAQLKLSLDLFKDTDTNSLIERAYDIQGDRIAYVEKGGIERNDKPVGAMKEEHELH